MKVSALVLKDVKAVKIMGASIIERIIMRSRYDVRGFSRILAIIFLINLLSLLLEDEIHIETGKTRNEKQHYNTCRRAGTVIGSQPELFDNVEA